MTDPHLLGGHCSSASRARRVALYSHDTQGLGHVRRNSLIAAAIVAAHPDTDVLLLTGAPEAAALHLPPRTSVLVLPPLAKTPTGAYRARSVPLSLSALVSMRAAMLEVALADYAPDLLVADKVPLGVHGELQPALREARSEFGTRTVLGLRDVLDERGVAIREWEENRSTDVIRTWYDQVWVYGDPAVFDPAREYRWPSSVRRKVAYTGYLARGRSRLLSSVATAPGTQRGHPPEGPFVLGLVGGGEDGVALSDAFAHATMPPGYKGVLITGPYLDAAERRRLWGVAERRHDLVVLEFVPDVPAYIARATATIAMAGYNTVCELLETGQPVLLAPRTAPRREQQVRAERLRRAGLADLVTAEKLSPAHLSAWLAGAVVRPRRDPADIDLDGLGRIHDLAGRLLTSSPHHRAKANHVAV